VNGCILTKENYSVLKREELPGHEKTYRTLKWMESTQTGSTLQDSNSIIIGKAKVWREAVKR
jgi:hypothetical protein